MRVEVLQFSKRIFEGFELVMNTFKIWPHFAFQIRASTEIICIKIRFYTYIGRSESEISKLNKQFEYFKSE